MNRYRLTILFLVLLSVVPAAGQQNLDRAVWVASRCKEKAKEECYKGTAFHIGRGVFFTNAHVAQEEEGYGQLVLERGVQPRAKLGAASVVCLNSRSLGRAGYANPYDVAKVQLPVVPSIPALVTTPYGPIPGNQITVIGYPGSAWLPVVAKGVVEEIRESDTFTFRVDAGRVGPGSSGSPVLNARNEVVGIVYAQDPLGRLFAATTMRFADRVCEPRRGP